MTHSMGPIMPKSTKIKMSKDMLAEFDKSITHIELDSIGDIVVHLSSNYYGDNAVCFNEEDLHRLLAFIHRNRGEKL